MGAQGQWLEPPASVAEWAALAMVNYGHFTTMRVEKGAVRGLTLHLERLVRDCRAVFGVALDPAAVRGDVAAAVADAAEPLTVRVTVFDPDLSLGLPAAAARPRTLVTVRPAPALDLPPQRALPVPYVRQVFSVKHTGLFEALHLRRAAQLDGWDDVLFTTPDGLVAEGATWNVGFVEGDRVVWPEAPQLPGVTQALLRRTGVPWVSRPVSVRELGSMDAAFATNAAVGLRPLAALGAIRFSSDHPLVDLLRERYARIAAESLH